MYDISWIEGDTIKKMRSWTKPEEKQNLIGRKKVDWSIFKYGTQIPMVFHEEFETANDGFHIEKGESKDIELLINGKDYSARLVNIDSKREKDTLQLRYDKNEELNPNKKRIII